MDQAKDIFISYAHVDNAQITDKDPGWVRSFYELLQTRLRQLMGGNADIWFDPSLAGNSVFGDEISHALKQVKALVSIISPRYVKSDWCKRELKEFYAAAPGKQGLRVGDLSRVFKVVKTPVDPAEIDEELIRDIMETSIGFTFYEVDRASSRIREYCQFLGGEAGGELQYRFIQSVFDVAFDLHRLLKSMRQPPAMAGAPAASGAAGTKAPTADAGAGSGKTVYLALTSTDLKNEREALRRELLERGHVVLPETEVPMVDGLFETEVRAALARSELSIHLAGNRYSLTPEDGSSSIVEIQNNLAVERFRQAAAGERFRRLIWMPRELAPHDPRQLQLLTRLREDETAQAGADLILDHLEKLKDLILERLNPPKPPAAAVPLASATGEAIPLRIYLINEPADRERVDPIDQFLYDQGFEVGRTDSETDPALVAESRRLNLQTCDAAMVYFGSAPRSWADVKLMELTQARGLGRTKPILGQLVCLGAPDTPDKQRFRTRQAQVVRLEEPFRPEALATFLQEIRAKASAAPTPAA